MEFFHISGRKLNLSLLKKKMNLLNAVTAVHGELQFQTWLHPEDPHNFPRTWFLSFPIPLGWLHADTPSAGGDEMTASRTHLFQGSKEPFLTPSTSPRSHFDFLPNLYDLLSSASFEFNLLIFF